MKNNVKNIIIPTAVLTVIALSMALLLGGTNLLTKSRIAALEKEKELAAVSKVIDGETSESELEYNGNKQTYYIASKEDNIVGYVFKTSANGYGGAVNVIVGIDVSGIITGVEITDLSEETPGLGQNAGKPNFYNQFKGKSGKLSAVKQNPDENEIKAVTGATITSKAVTSAVNTALELFECVKGGA